MPNHAPHALFCTYRVGEKVIAAPHIPRHGAGPCSTTVCMPPMAGASLQMKLTAD